MVSNTSWKAFILHHATNNGKRIFIGSFSYWWQNCHCRCYDSTYISQEMTLVPRSSGKKWVLEFSVAYFPCIVTSAFTFRFWFSLIIWSFYDICLVRIVTLIHVVYSPLLSMTLRTDDFNTSISRSRYQECSINSLNVYTYLVKLTLAFDFQFLKVDLPSRSLSSNSKRKGEAKWKKALPWKLKLYFKAKHFQPRARAIGKIIDTSLDAARECYAWFKI